MLILNAAGTADEPLVALGIADNDRRPVISGDNALTRQALDYWNEPRSVVKVGGSSTPDSSGDVSYIYIQGLDIQSARPAYSFSDDSGQTDTYSENAAAIHVEKGDHITVYDCVLHDAGNGLFTSSQAANITISSNHVYDNGISGSIYHHNS